jgi:DNA-binding PucR family transcriptional regulator
VTTAAALDAVHEVAEGMLADLDALAVEMADHIHEEIDGLGPELHGETVLSCRSNMALIRQMLADDLEASSAKAPAEALHYAREYVRSGMPIDALLQAYRIGHRVYWSAWLERLQAAGFDRDGVTEAVLYTSQWLFTYVDAVTVDITDSFMHERERWVRSAAALRSEEVRAILDGSQSDERRSSQRLRYELSRTHVAVLVWAEDGDDADGTIGLYERVALDVCKALGGQDVLYVPFGRLTLAAWIGMRGSEVDLDALGPVGIGEALQAGVRLAVGEPAAGLEGFRRSHEDALVAQRVARMRRRRSGSATRYADAALLGLLAADAEAARRFAEAELGALGEDSDSARRVAATLKVFLEEGSSHVRAARRLGVHENTVAYRIKRAEALLGRSVDDRRLELRAALLLAGALKD